MSDIHSITIRVHEDSLEQVRELIAQYPGTVQLGRLRAAQDVGASSRFPVLDPTLIEAFKEATVILAAGSASLDFLIKLRKLISSSKGKVAATDDKTKEPIE